jgi:hypothetical protein
LTNTEQNKQENDFEYKNHINFLELVETFKNNFDNIAIFIGAGLSMPLFSSWPAFLKDMVVSSKQKKYIDSNLENEFLENIENGKDYLDIADHCSEKLGITEYRNLIEKHFDKDFTTDDIPLAYKRLLELPVINYITTNYDKIPDKLGVNTYNNLNVAEAQRNQVKNRKMVFKLHGDVNAQESIVLTRTEFKEIIQRTDIQNYINNLFSSKIVLFLGFSLSDPHIDQLLDRLNTISGQKNISHYVFLNAIGLSDFGIQKNEKRFGIKIIPYIPSTPSHPEVLDLINTLGSAGKKKDNPQV